MDMNSCHVLLGKPWQYDCKAVHDCVKNVFIIEKDGRNHSLMPLQKVELGRRRVSVGYQVALLDSERLVDQSGM